MKHLFLAAALLAALPAFAQSTAQSGATANGAAVNAGVQMTNNFAAPAAASPYTVSDVNYRGLEKPSANVNLTGISSPPSPKTCADAGVSIGGGGRGGGGILSFGTGPEEGCDMARDIEVVVYLLKLPIDSVEYKVGVARACAKASVKAAFEHAGEGKRCDKVAPSQNVASAPLALLP